MDGLTDKEFALTEKRIKALIKKWAEPLGFNWWKMTYSYVRNPEDMPERGDRRTGDSGWSCTASTHTAWEYRDAKISFNMPACFLEKDDELEKVFVHELCHVLVNEMRELAPHERPFIEWIAHEESVCTSLQRTIMWAYEAGMKSRKRTH